MFPFLEVDSLPSTNIPAFLQVAKKKLVVILGKDTGEELESLQAIRKVVEIRGYQCQLIKELPEHSEMGLIGKVLFTALSARFVIIENSTPSGHLYEMPFVRMAECVIAIMQREGQGATWMTEDSGWRTRRRRTRITWRCSLGEEAMARAGRAGGGARVEMLS